MKHDYYIFPPWIEDGDVFNKDIVITTKDGKQYRYDLEGNKKRLYYTEHGIDIIEKTELIIPSEKIITKRQTGFWAFPTMEMAFIQKLIFLKAIREYFYRKQKEDRLFFDTQISPKINEKLEHLLEKYPEVML